MNKMVKIILSVLVAVGLAVLAIVFVPRWIPQQSLDGATGVLEPGPLVVTEVTQTRHADVEGSEGCDVRLLYPQVSDDGTMTLSDDAREKMNTAILEQVKDFFSAAASSLDEAATAWATECQTDLAATIGDGADLADDPAASAINGWVSEIGYNIKLNDGKHFSVGIANYLSTGGAHPNTTELFLTFDVATGNVLTLRDVLPTEKILSFETSEKQWLIDNAADMLFQESLEEFQAFVASPTQERADAYVDDAIYYLTSTEYVTFYNPYMIAPYAFGPIEVRLPR